MDIGSTAVETAQDAAFVWRKTENAEILPFNAGA